MRKLLQKIVFRNKKTLNVFNDEKILYFFFNNILSNLNTSKLKIECFSK